MGQRDLKTIFFIACGAIAMGLSLSAAAAPCTTTGPQRMAVLRVGFATQAYPRALTAPVVESLFFGAGEEVSLNQFWREQSAGRASAVGTSYPRAARSVYWLDQDLTNSGGPSYYKRVFDAVAEMAAGDVEFSHYQRVVFLVPKLANAYGISTMGCVSLRTPTGMFTGSVTVLDATVLASMERPSAVAVAAHELGHALGLDHASTIRLAAPGTRPTVDEGTSPYSVMGGSTYLAGYGFLERRRLGWILGPGAARVTTPGIYRIGALERAVHGVPRFRWVPRGSSGKWLAIEYRHPVANSAQLPEWYFPRVLVYSGDPAQSSGDTYLVDSIRLKRGVAWRDPYTSLTLNILRQESDEIALEVSY